MSFLGIGDLAQGFRLRHQDLNLRQQLQRLGQEVTTGRIADLPAALSGDLASIAAIEGQLTKLDGFKIVTTEAAEALGVVQTALATAQTAGAIASNLLSVTLTPTDRQIDTLAADARQRFGGVVAALNARAADRYLLSGVATDTPPLAEPEAILGALDAAVAGQSSATGIAAAVQAWFDAPAGGGGYLDTAYRGSAQPLAPFRTAEGESVPLTLTAADPALRDMLRGLALAALVDRGALAGDAQGRAALLQTAGETIAGADSDLTERRAAVGSAEAAVEASVTRNAAERTRLELRRNDVTAVDPYDAATALEAVRSQTETLYTVTARLAGLRLAGYLK